MVPERRRAPLARLDTVQICAVKWKNVQLYYNNHYFKVWDRFGLSQYRFRAGNFSVEV